MFRNSDAKEVARLHRSTIRSVNKNDYPKKHIEVWSGRTSAKKFRESAKETKRFVAIENGKIVGFADYRKNELRGLYVHKGHIKKGVGKRLLKRLEKHAYENGIRTMKCISTITGHKFYEKCGYKTVKKAKYTMQDQKLNVYEMKKRLKPHVSP